MSRQNLQTILMPVAMIVGGVFHHWLGELRVLVPYLIFAMLFIPFCGMRLSELRVSGLHAALLGFQAAVSIGVYAAVRPFDVELAQGAMICVLAPTATAAVVVASMLGARVPTMLAYSLLVNFAVALGAPLFFAVIAPGGDVSFGRTFVTILWRVVPMIVMPFVTAMALRWLAPKIADGVQRMGVVSFYLWVVALTTTTAQVVNFVATQSQLSLTKGFAFAGVALVLCLVQFFGGKWIGSRWGETVAGGQALGQKNTVLAIWLAQSYLNPVSSIAPAAYVMWQTIFNSIQLYLRGRKQK
jgi:BASS family bile acid:Na+ symporter